MPDLSKLWILLLAAGESSRFGSSKALASWHGGTLLSHAVTTSLAVAGPRVLAVLGAGSEQLQAHVKAIRSTVNSQWYQGMGSSIATGIRAITEQDAQAEAVIVLPVDQPLVSPRHLTQLAESCFRTGDLAMTTDSVVIGPPACLPRRYFSQTMTLKGVQGLKSLLTELSHTTVYNPEALMDADTPDALNRLMCLLPKS